MAVTDYDREKTLDVQSVSGTPTVDKAVPILIRSTLIDSFENGSSKLGWESGGNFSIDTTGLIEDANSLQIASANELTSQTQSLSSVIDYDCRFKFSVNIDNQTGNASDEFELQIDNSGTSVISIAFFGDGNIGAQSSTPTTWTANSRIDIQVALDFANDQYELFVNGTSQGTFNFTNSVSSVDELTFRNATTASGQTVNGFVDELSSGGEGSASNDYIGISFANISSESDLAVYDNGDTLLGYEIEDFDATNEEAVLWVYDSYVRDGSTQVKVVYGNGPASSEEGTASDVWGNTGQNARIIQHLNEDPLTATDSSPNGNNGTVTGASSTAGQFDGAASFDGNDDYIDYDSVIDSSTWTLSFWVSSTTSAGTLEIYWQQDPDDGTDNKGMLAIGSGFTNEDLDIFDGDGTQTNIIDGANVRTGNFELITITFDNGTVDAYLNGTHQTTVSSFTNWISNGHPLTQGRRFAGTDDFNFAGQMDESKVYVASSGAAKSSDWIQAEYDASPAAGQTFFSQNAAQDVGGGGQTISAPVSTGTGVTPNPQVNAGNVNVNVPESIGTGVSPNPVVFTDLFASIPASTGTAASPAPQVVAGNTNISLIESVGTGFTPNPTLTLGETIRVPESTGTAVTPDPVVKGGAKTLSIPTSTGTAVSPNPEILADQTVSIPSSNGFAASPAPTVNANANVSIPVSTGTAVSPNPNVRVIIDGPTVSPPLEFKADSMDKYFKTENSD